MNNPISLLSDHGVSVEKYHGKNDEFESLTRASEHQSLTGTQARISLVGGSKPESGNTRAITEDKDGTTL